MASGQQFEEPTLQDVEYERRQMIIAFHKTFTSDEGKVVLAALKSEFYDTYIPTETVTPNNALTFIGERNVIVHIDDILSQATGDMIDE